MVFLEVLPVQTQWVFSEAVTYDSAQHMAASVHSCKYNAYTTSGSVHKVTQCRVVAVHTGTEHTAAHNTKQW